MAMSANALPAASKLLAVALPVTFEPPTPAARICTNQHLRGYAPQLTPLPRVRDFCP